MSATPSQPTLADLLRRAIDDRTGAPLRDIQAIVEAEEALRPRGMSLNRSTASQILRGAYRGTPSQATVRAIGWLAGVTDEVAFAAAGQSAPGRPFAEELPAAADTLNGRERAVVLDIVRALLAQRQRVDVWKATAARALTDVIGDLTRITQTLENASTGGEISTQIVSRATEELAEAISRIRRLAEDYAPDETTPDADA